LLYFSQAKYQERNKQQEELMDRRKRDLGAPEGTEKRRKERRRIKRRSLILVPRSIGPEWKKRIKDLSKGVLKSYLHFEVKEDPIESVREEKWENLSLILIFCVDIDEEMIEQICFIFHLADTIKQPHHIVIVAEEPIPEGWQEFRQTILRYEAEDKLTRVRHHSTIFSTMNVVARVCMDIAAKLAQTQ
jgi:hypothetical protein